MADPAPAPQPPSWMTGMPGMTSTGTTGQSLTDIIQQALYGASGRSAVSNRPLSGPLPTWVQKNPAALASVRGGVLDPYLVGSSPDTWQVWTGTAKPTDAAHGPGTSHPYGGGSVPSDYTRTAGQVKNDPYLWDADKVTEAIDKFRAAGFTKVQDFESLKAAWGQLVDRAAATYSMSSGQIKITPWDALGLYADEAKAQGFNTDGSRTTRSTQRTVSEVDEGEAWDTLRSTVSRLLGRDPEDQEVRDFTYRMNNLAAKSPTISRSTTTTDAAGNSSTSSHVKPGFTNADMARSGYEEAQSDPDYAEYQSATTYFNAALSAMGSIGGN